VLGVALSPLGIDNLGRFYPSIALPAAAAVFCIGRVVAGDRRWQSWAGLALAAAPALFWVFFVIGEFLGPAH
jgi:4-amino-4-deoxy-L-arabinose transferase-like glycosyltransferase